MSVEAMAIVLHHAPVTGTDKVVALGIANHDGDGGAWPSLATLARYAGVSVRTVQRSLRVLEAAGIIETTTNGGGTHATRDHERPNRYRITLACPAGCDGTTAHRVTPTSPRGGTPTSPRGVTPTSPPPRNPRHPPGDAHVTPPVTPTSPEPSVEPSVEPKTFAVTGHGDPATSSTGHGKTANGKTKTNPTKTRRTKTGKTNTKPRRRDLIFEALVAACGLDPSELTTSGRGRVNVAAKQLREIGASPEGITARAQVHRTRWPNAELTPTSLAANYAQLGTSGRGPAPNSAACPDCRQPVAGHDDATCVMLATAVVR